MFGSAAPRPKARKKAGFALPDAPPTPAPAAIAVAPLPAATPAGSTPMQEAILVARTVEGMRATFQADGGDVELVDLEGSLALVHLKRACAGCSAASLTLGGLQKRISEALGRTVRVMPVKFGGEAGPVARDDATDVDRGHGAAGVAPCGSTSPR